MTTVFSVDRPDHAIGQTHVLIVAVGSYPHLLGGTAHHPEIDGGMGQLDSPPLSAAKIADWFIGTFHNPSRPLGSVDLLVSNDADQTYTRPDTGEVFDIAQADLSAVRDAALAWKAKGDASPEDILVFYFSGHGIALGQRHALLTRDFGRVPQRPLLGAINLNMMIEGMRSCQAGRQIFLVDACRAATETLYQQTTETGDVLIPTSLPINRNWQGCLYHASLGGMPAYGVPGDVSLFAKALLKSLRGPGATDDDAPNVWWIRTVKLSEALDHMAGDIADPIHGPAQKPQTGYQTQFDFHLFTDPPRVPIYITTSWYHGDEPPDDAIGMRVTSAPDLLVEWTPPWQSPNPCHWSPDRFESWVEPGRHYTIRLQTQEGVPVPQMSRYVSPPYKIFPLVRPDA